MANAQLVKDFDSTSRAQFVPDFGSVSSPYVNTNLRALTLTEYPATISLGREVLTTTNSLYLTTSPATISLDRNVQANLETLALTTLSASIGSGPQGQVLKINGLSIYHP